LEGEKIPDFGDQNRQMAGYGVPDDGFIHDIIAMNQYITESDNAAGLGDSVENFVICMPNPVQSLADDFKIPLNGPLGDEAGYFGRQRDPCCG